MNCIRYCSSWRQEEKLIWWVDNPSNAFFDLTTKMSVWQVELCAHILSPVISHHTFLGLCLSALTWLAFTKKSLCSTVLSSVFWWSYHLLLVIRPPFQHYLFLDRILFPIILSLWQCISTHFPSLSILFLIFATGQQLPSTSENPFWCCYCFFPFFEQFTSSSALLEKLP